MNHLLHGDNFTKHFVDHLCYLCHMFFMLLRLFIAALWSPAGKGLTSWLLFVMFNCVFVSFPCGIMGQVWYLTQELVTNFFYEKVGVCICKNIKVNIGLLFLF